MRDLGSHSFFIELYQKYDDELRQLAHHMREKFYAMHRLGHETTFGDVEGELMYLMIRETQPEIAFEISPNAGWSTNYIVAALTANQKGTLHSFELLTKLKGKPIEEVIRNNQHPAWDQDRLVLHIGDARDTVPDVPGAIDFLLIDSCHDAWFAEWYIPTVFPRVNGPTFVQDIAFVDEAEPSTESDHLWAWAEREQIPLKLVGAVEAAVELSGTRTDYAERRGLRSNSVMCWLPTKERVGPPVLEESVGEWIKQADLAIKEGDNQTADTLLNRSVAKLLGQPTRIYRHRSFFAAGICYARMKEVDEARRCYHRALASVLHSDTQQRAKGFDELLDLFVRHRQWRLAAQTTVSMLFNSRTQLSLARKAIGYPPRLVKLLRGRH